MVSYFCFGSHLDQIYKYLPSTFFSLPPGVTPDDQTSEPTVQDSDKVLPLESSAISPVESDQSADNATDAVDNIAAELDNTTNDNAPFDETIADNADLFESDTLNASFNSTSFNGPKSHLFNALNSRQVLLVLKGELHFHGILDVTLLTGNACIYGYNLRTDQTVRTFSPRGQSFCSIAPVSRQQQQNNDTFLNDSHNLDDVQALIVALQRDFLNSDIYDAINAFDADRGDALLLLQPADRQSSGFHMIDKYMRQSIFPNNNAFNAHRPNYRSEFILRTQFYTRPKTRLNVNPQWPLATTTAAANSRTICIGGKGVGKSTFVRYMINAAVQRHNAALLIDLDIGQPELFVPQCVSATLISEPLLGAGYMQARAPDRALLFGELNVTVAPLRYFRCVLRLLRDCAARPEWQGVPWIVNTMGYNRGFGLEMMAALLRVFPITDVVQIQSQRRLDNYECVLEANVVNGFPFQFFRKEVESALADNSSDNRNALPPPKATHRMHAVRSMARKFGEKTADWDMSAKDTRMATVLSTLGAVLTDGGEWLTDVRPVW